MPSTDVETVDLTSDSIAAWQNRLDRLLDHLQHAQKVLTYLQAADAIDLPGPHRIHRVTELLEQTMAHDHAAGQPLRAALVVSRARDGVPAPGFFERARALGAQSADCSDTAFHQRCVHDLFYGPNRR